MRVQVKVCGLMRPEDAVLAAELGASHVGCTIDPESPRNVDPGQAKEVFQGTGRKVLGVLHFRAATAAEVIETARKAGTRHVQLLACGEPEAEACEASGLTVYRVYEVPTGSNMLPTLTPEPTKKRPAILQAATVGTGITFPWELLGNDAPPATFIGGGVRPENVCALLTHHPYGMDVGSGVEIAPGVIDPDRLALLFDTLHKGV